VQLLVLCVGGVATGPRASCQPLEMIHVHPTPASCICSDCDNEIPVQFTY